LKHSLVVVVVETCLFLILTRIYVKLFFDAMFNCDKCDESINGK